MYPQILPGYGLIRHHMTTGEGDGHAYILYGVALVTTPTAVHVATATHTHFGTDIINNLVSNAVQLIDTEATINNGGVLSQATFVSTYTGGEGATSVPPQVALLVRKQSVGLGKHNRGRIYVPGLPASFLNTDQTTIKPADLTAMQTDFTQWLTDIQGDAYTSQMVILHRNASTPTVVVQLVVEAQIATQRRRNRKAAHH